MYIKCMRSGFRVTYSKVSPVGMKIGRIVSVKESHSVRFKEGSLHVTYEIRFQENLLELFIYTYMHAEK